MQLCRVLYGVLLCAATSPLAATTVTFDDISNIPSFGNPINVRATFAGLGIDNTYAGFGWPSPGSTEFWGVVSNADSFFGTVGAFSGAQAAWNWGGALSQNILFDSPVTIGGAYFNVFQAGQGFDAATVQLRAYDATGALVGSSSPVNLDKSGQHPMWEFVALNAHKVSRLNILATQNDPDPNFAGLGLWAMDDLDVVPDAVVLPEPTSVGLITLGLLICMLARWSKRRSQPEKKRPIGKLG